jgi:hypothetical protein
MNRCGSFTTTIDETSMVQDSDNVVCSAALNHSLRYKLLNHFSGDRLLRGESLSTARDNRCSRCAAHGYSLRVFV